MIKLTLFNTLMVELLNTKYLARIVFDSSRFPFSLDLKLVLFYSIQPWFNSFIEHKNRRTNKIIDAICPILFDLRIYIEQNK